MTIRPVTSAALVSNYNNVAFEGKKKKNPNKNLNITKPVSQKLAVPLAATIIAMSPMGSTSPKAFELRDNPRNNITLYQPSQAELNNGDIISSKAFVLDKKTTGGDTYKVRYEVNLINNDDDDNDFETIQIKYRDLSNPNGKGSVYNVRNFTTYKFGIVSEDGSESNNFSLDEIIAYDTKYDKDAYGNYIYLTEKSVCDYVKSQLNSARNNSGFEKSTVIRKLRPSSDFNLQNVAPESTMQNASHRDYSDYKCLGYEDFEGSNGKYKMYYYSLPNSDDIDLVTISKDGGEQLAVSNNIVSNGIFNADDSDPVTIQYGITKVYDNDRKSYYISDKNLAYALVSIFNNPKVSKMAFSCKAYDREYICHKGVVMPLDFSEEE